MVLNVAISDLFYEISYWFTNPDTTGDTCRFSGWLQQFGTMSSILWITFMTYVIHQVVANPSKVDFENRMVMYQAGIWGFSFVTAFLPLTTNSYGQASGWCWIQADKDADIVWRFFIFYGPLIVILGYISYMYYQTSISIGDDKTIVRRMGLYPAILVMAWFFGLINRLVEAGGSHSFGLTCIHAFFMGMYGFWNCCAYVYTSQVRQTVFGLQGPTDTLPTKQIEMDSKRSNTDIEYSVSDDAYLSGSNPHISAQSNMTMTYTADEHERMSAMDVVYAKESSDIDISRQPHNYQGDAIEVQPDYTMGDTPDPAGSPPPMNSANSGSEKI